MASNVKLQDLPIELHSHIMQQLFPVYAYPEIPSSRMTHGILTDDMLHAAQSSVALGKAVVDAVGSKAESLSFNQSVRIWEWIPFLHKQVKYFSFRGVQYAPCPVSDNQPTHLADIFYEVILITLKALYCNCVALEELDLERLIMIVPELEEAVFEHVIKAIQRSSSSLRRITLTVNRLTAMAFRHVTLPNLEVADIYLDYDYYGDMEMEYPLLAKNFGDILKGINGPADCHENNVALREMTIHNIREAPIMDSESCSTLFSAVEKLTLTTVKTLTELADFIGRFRNLKTLYLSTKTTCAEDMHKITRGCSNLEKLELRVWNSRLLSGALDFTENPSGMKELFESFQKKLWNLEIQACLPSELVKTLGENSPNLRILEMEIDSENVSGLTSLLGTHCRKVRELHLKYSTKAMACLGRDGWPAFAQSIRSASDELRVIEVYGERMQEPYLEPATNEMVDSIIDIIQSTGHHASHIYFDAPMDTRNPFIVLDGLWRIVNIAKTYRTSIKTLNLNFLRSFSHGQYWVDDAELDELLRFSAQLSDFRDKFFSAKHQTEVDFRDISILYAHQVMERNNNNGGEDVEADDGLVDAGLVDEVPDDQIAG